MFAAMLCDSPQETLYVQLEAHGSNPSAIEIRLVDVIQESQGSLMRRAYLEKEFRHRRPGPPPDGGTVPAVSIEAG
jgi:hypothetical protein